MEPEEVIALFDSCWFNLEIFNKHSFKSISQQTPDHEIQENSSEPKISTLPSILVRSKSDQLSSMTNFDSDCCSPNSVLFTPHLQTILSVKEVTEEASRKPQPIQENLPPKENRGKNRGRRGKNMGGRRNKGKMSKSLSDLEFEELKGFMDLGFVFSEEDKDSSLVEIIPGLQRLGKKNEEDEDEGVGEISVPRPYLSEAWEDLERKKRENPLMNWRVPDQNNEMDMKDGLKWWAHTVASAVR